MGQIMYDKLESKTPVISGFEIKWFTLKFRFDVRKIFKRNKRQSKSKNNRKTLGKN